MRPRSVSCAILASILVLTLPLVPAQAAPPLPFVLNGVITMNGGRVPDQLLLEARINQETYAATYTRDGSFGVDPVFKVPADEPETERVEGGRDGDAVEIYLDGVKVSETVFRSGVITRLVIEVNDLLNAPPRAYFDEVNSLAGFSTRFHGGSSSDPEGGPLTYSWGFGDGGASDQADPLHTYRVAGDYEAKLVVRDQYASSSTYTRTIRVEELPIPEYWQLATLGTEHSSHYSEETYLRLHAQSIEPVSATIARYEDHTLNDGSVSLPVPQMWSLSLSNPQAVSYPLYIEVPISKLGEVPSNSLVYTWRDGGWARCVNSGASEDMVWAYLTQDELGEGLVSVGLSDGYVRVNVGEIRQSGGPGESTASIQLTSVGYSGAYNVYVRVDGRLTSVSTVPLSRGESKTVDVAFGAAPGVHTVSVNGVEDEYKVSSLLGSLFVVGLGLTPVSLISLVLKRQLHTSP
jgi:PKD repeat protein